MTEKEIELAMEGLFRGASKVRARKYSKKLSINVNRELYEVSIEGRKYLDLHPRNHKPLDQYLKGILQWRPSNPIRKMNYMDT